ncbi:MAG: hypothetical protein HRU17_03240 [Polyangiaceae bacterium]|nr:hypothetical protein [Polyangiaceae bacterium]
MRHLKVCWLIPCLTLGCFGDGDARIPGELLGTFTAEAVTQENGCGPQPFDAADNPVFEIQLSEDAPKLYWITSSSAPTTGTLAEDGSFSFETVSRHTPAEGCVIDRGDAFIGAFADGDMHSGALDGVLTYSYALAEQSDCSALIGEVGGVSELPCSISYSVSATTQE